MKKNHLLLLAIAFNALVIGTSSCSRDSEIISENGKKISLIAPTGESIGSERSLKLLAIGEEINSSTDDVVITDIEYLKVSKGLAAIVSYKDSKGMTGNYLTTRGVKVNYPSTANVRRVGSDSESSSSGGGSTTTYKCEGSCSSEIKCSIKGTIGGGTVTTSCTCQSCTLVVTTNP